MFSYEFQKNSINNSIRVKKRNKIESSYVFHQVHRIEYNFSNINRNSSFYPKT